MCQDLLEQLERYITEPHFNAWLAPKAHGVSREHRTVEIVLPYRQEFGNSLTTPMFHGGVLACLADVTGHATVALFHGGHTPTIVLQVDYLAPATGSEARAIGRLRRLGRTISRADVEIFCGDRLVAIARGSFHSAASAP